MSTLLFVCSDFNVWTVIPCDKSSPSGVRKEKEEYMKVLIVVIMNQVMSRFSFLFIHVKKNQPVADSIGTDFSAILSSIFMYTFRKL